MKKALILLFVLAFLPCLSSAQIYKWTDENGVTHWTNTAPPESVEVAEKTGEYISPSTTDSGGSVGYQSEQATYGGESSQQNDMSYQEGNSPGYSDALIQSEAQKLNDRMKEMDRHHYRNGIRSSKEKEDYLQKRERLKNKLSTLENSPEQYLDEKRETATRRGTNVENKSGAVLAPVAGGYVDKDGKFYPGVVGGAINPKTGHFTPAPHNPFNE